MAPFFFFFFLKTGVEEKRERDRGKKERTKKLLLHKTKKKSVSGIFVNIVYSRYVMNFELKWTEKEKKKKKS